MNRFYVKTEVYFGEGALDKLGDFEGQKVVIITDAFMVKSGVADRIRSRLPACEVRIFSEVVPDPPIEIVTKGVELLQSFAPETVIALGGGSSIDAAKAILKIVRELGGTRIALAAIPTTSGTGSEVTRFAVITDAKKGMKYPLESESLLPDIAILDPDLVKTAPPAVTADTGMDVITHALESYVSTRAADCTDAFAEKALSLAFEYLPLAYQDGGNLLAREKMHDASCIAGMSFNIAGLGLNHGIAHAIGGKLHISHGRINAMLLPFVIDFNAETDGDYTEKVYPPAAQKYGLIAKRLGLSAPGTRAGVKNLIREVQALNRKLGIPATLRELGADMKLFESLKAELVDAALADVCTQTNPRKPTRADVEGIMKKIAG